MKVNKSASLLLASLLLLSCQTDESPAATDGQEVSLNLCVEAIGMEQAGGAMPTRSTSGAIDMTFGADAATRSSKNTDELTIKTLYLMQFGGTAAGSAVVKTSAIVLRESSDLAEFKFEKIDAPCRVYVVANFDPKATNGTTLGNFEKQVATYAAGTTIDTNTGIPMCGSVDINPATVVGTPKVKLEAMVAKLIVTYTVDPAALADYKPGTTVTSLDIVLRSVASCTVYKPTLTPATAVRPEGITFSDVKVGKTGATTYTYYVPENIAGNSKANITDWKKRSKDNAPADALYFEITGRHKEDKASIIVASFIGDPKKPNEFNIYRNYAYTLTAVIKNGKTGNADATDQRVTILPDPLSNCFVITDNAEKEYSFISTIRGNGNESVPGINYGALPDLNTATEARVIWQTGGIGQVIKKVALVDKAVIYTTGPAKEGNAVIGVFASSAANAPCLWSWHIWKVNGALPPDVECTKNPSPASAPAKFKMMALNLGAFNNTPGDANSMGLKYQWGRKDPFPGAGGWSGAEPKNIYGSWNNGSKTGSWSGVFSLNKISGAKTETWAAQYPTAYITGSDWTTKNDALWGTPWGASGSVGNYNGSQGVKSIYDPCPTGYRVPPQDTWNKQTSVGTFANNGMTLGNVASGFWFPAAGYRDGSNGVLAYVSAGGLYWSSSPISSGSTNAGILNFINGNVYPQNNFNRANGLSMRCVQE